MTTHNKMTKEELKSVWTTFKNGDISAVEHWNNRYGNFYSPRPHPEDRVVFLENRLLNALVVLNKVVEYVVQDNHD